MSNQGFLSGLKDDAARVGNTGKGLFRRFEDSRFVQGTKSFLNSNSLVAKFCFLILVILVYVYLLRLGTGIIAWLYSPTKSPKLIPCVKNAKKLKVITQNPNLPHSIPILRSRAQRQGIEFTWSVWMFIDDLQYKVGQRKHVFHKGSEKLNAQQTAFPNNAPGLYIHPTRNSLIVVMNTFDDILEEFDINDIPMHKWFNVAIRLKGQYMDIYMNGRIAARHIFTGVPKQNYGDVYVNMNGGYSGLLSDLWYHDFALSGLEILEIVRAGPSLAYCERPDATGAQPPYLALQWYFQQDNAPATGAPLWPTDASATSQVFPSMYIPSGTKS
ncbi:hypothetical protein [uncultured Mediterranean phage]|nr:hypothetical protein [uncultured Mediterranean phage]